MTGNFKPGPIFKLVKDILEPVQNSKIPVRSYLNERDIIIDNRIKQEQPYVNIKK